MTSRLLAIALFIPLAALFALGCSSDDKTDSQGVSLENVPGFATVVAPLAPMTPAIAPSDAAPNAVITPAPPPSSLPPVGGPPAAPPPGLANQAPYPFTDASAARTSLLNVAQSGTKMEPLDGVDPSDIKAYPGWLNTYPSLRLVGPLMSATPNNVSVYRGPLKTTEPISANNHKVIVFSVIDDKGGCAAGVIRGYPNYSEYKSVDIPAPPCNADSALAVLRR